MKYEDKIAYLDISSWNGISIGAEHYYGKLVCGDESEELQRRLSKQDARYLNKKCQATCYQEGMWDTRWDSPTQLMRAARARLGRMYPNAVLLIRGSSSCLDPQEPLWTPSETSLRTLEQIHDAWELADGWEGGEKEAKRLSKEWDEEIERITGVNKDGRGNVAL